MSLKEKMAPEVNNTTLDNGIRIVTKKIPHVRSLSMGVWVGVGARDETHTESGLSHFIEHMIFKGTQKRTGFQIAKEFDSIGGHTNAFTAMESTCYHARVMDTHLTTMVEILSDIFLNSAFDEIEVEKERPVILQELGMVEDSPDEYIHLLSSSSFWGDDPLGRSILGTRDNIMRIDSDMIKSFFSRLYQPRCIVISIAGNLDHNRFVDLLAPTFGSVRPGNGFPERVTPKACSAIQLHNRDLEQAHLCLCTGGLPITDPRRFAFSLINTVLGGNMSSRLFQEIRELRGLAYSVYSFINSHVDTGMFGVYAGVAPDKAHETTALILNQMRRLKNEPVTPAELLAAKEFTKGSLLLASESVDNQMVRLAQNEIHFDHYLPLHEIIEQIDAVTADQLLDLASALFREETLNLTILGPVDDRKSFEKIFSL